MKIFFALIFSIIFFASRSSAQEIENPVRWGLGVGLASASGAAFHIPVIYDNFRIEPEISFRSTSSSSNSSDGSTQETISTSASSTSQSVSIASGFYFLFSIDNSFLCYCGPRIGVTYTVTTSDDSTNQTFSDTSEIPQLTISHSKQRTTTLTAGISFGAEYFISKHVSIGGELLLTYSHTGTPVVEESQTSIPSNSNLFTASPSRTANSTYGEGTAAFLRFYF
jgi:hypothetical protein